MNVDPSSLSYEEQVKLERFMIKIQVNIYIQFAILQY
jgi:hypothetical protein